jgi:glycosyltransferase involved in cell wall biosynthesis
MPDHVPVGLADRVRERSGVFPVGIDFQPHREFLTGAPERAARPPAVPLLVWNHRWEYDKAPEVFVEALLRLKERGVAFRVDICGQAGENPPPAFALAAEKLAAEIVHLGFYERREDYFAALARADVVVSTARHEFFGVAVTEAMYMGCLPVLPRGLSYPEILPPHLHQLFLYEDARELDAFLAHFLRHPPLAYRRDVVEAASRCDWAQLAGRMDDIVEGLAAGRDP